MAGLIEGSPSSPALLPAGEKGAEFFVRGWGEVAELAGSVGVLLGL
jgi:hypothetical protein